MTESVAASLAGQKLASFTRVSTAVQQAVEEALTRILTPMRSIDVLREVKEAQVGGCGFLWVRVCGCVLWAGGRLGCCGTEGSQGGACKRWCLCCCRAGRQKAGRQAGRG